MRTVKIIHSTPRQETEQLMGCAGMLVVLAILGGIYNLVHKLWESPLALDRLAISWSDDVVVSAEEDGSEIFKADAYAPRSEYDITARISNRSPLVLYKLDYTATLRVCDTKEQETSSCPIVGTTSGMIRPELQSQATGMIKEKIRFSGAEKYEGFGRLSIDWTDAAGVNP